MRATALAPPPSAPRAAPPGDLRELVGRLEAGGHLTRVRETVDWRCELGARARAERAPLLFTAIRGYPGWQVFVNGLFGRAAIALALGLDPEAPARAIAAACRRRLAAPVAPVMAPSAPFLACVAEGGAVDLLRLPVPQWSDQDAGRYLGTWHLNITRDPETGERNVGVYRMQVLGPARATVNAMAGTGLGAHLAKAERIGQPLPMAVAIGVPESCVIAGAASCPRGMDEYGLAGALQQAPVELLRLEATGLDVPAGAEIVIEGRILPGRRARDGPFFDYCGHVQTQPAAPVFAADRILMREGAIFRGAAVGVAGGEDHQLFAFLARLGLVDFHGPRGKQRLQNVLWKHRRFRAIQAMGQARRALFPRRRS